MFTSRGASDTDSLLSRGLARSVRLLEGNSEKERSESVKGSCTNAAPVPYSTGKCDGQRPGEAEFEETEARKRNRPLQEERHTDEAWVGGQGELCQEVPGGVGRVGQERTLTDQ